MELPDVDLMLEQLTLKTAEILKSTPSEEPIIVGIHTGGLWVAEHLHQELQNQQPLYSLDISFYRDDYHDRGLNPKVRGSHLPSHLDNATVLLVDDVIMSGRTLRAAINELFDYGRPACVKLVTLLDLGRRELPIQPDAVGGTLLLENEDRIKLKGPSPLRFEWQSRHSTS
jgi:pyrimidine operon attenuation protein/uracil phosphoribosyltransferase